MKGQAKTVFLVIGGIAIIGIIFFMSSGEPVIPPIEPPPTPNHSFETGWIAFSQDAESVTSNSLIKMQGDSSIEFKIDASKTDGDSATYENNSLNLDLSQKSQAILNIASSDINAVADAAKYPSDGFTLLLGNDVNNYSSYRFHRALGNPYMYANNTFYEAKVNLDSGTQYGSVDWTSITFARFIVNEVMGNAQDFSVYVDGIEFK